MNKLITSILLIGTIFFVQNLKAEEALDSLNYQTNSEFSYSFSSDDFLKTPFRTFDFVSYLFNLESPRIDIIYNINNFSIDKKEFPGKFYEVPDLEIKAGYELNSIANNKISTKSNYDYLRLSNYNYNLTNEYANNRTITEGWQFGFGSIKGYGWALGKNANLTLYNGNNFNWHIFNFNQEEKEYKFNNKLDKLHHQFKFGNSFEAGLNLKLFNSIGINVAYEQDQVFPVHKFWYWAASKTIEEIAKSFTNNFIQNISNRNLIAGPIINFIIKNGISYGIYELRKTSMNWPINTEAPFVIEKFKFGLSYTF